MACLVSEKTPEMMAWEAMMVASVASTTMGIEQTVGNEMIKGVAGGLGVAQNQGPLAEIIAEAGPAGPRNTRRCGWP